MVRPEYDISLINRIANSAAVRPFVDYRVDQSKPLDFTPAVGPIERTGIIFLSNGKDALSAFALSDAMEWQAHVMFAATCRGAKAVEIGRQMIDFMKPRANLIWASIPVGNRKARWFARQMGFHAIGQDQFEAEGAVEIVAHGDGTPRLGFILQNEVIH